jgi:hypothetical protein
MFGSVVKLCKQVGMGEVLEVPGEVLSTSLRRPGANAATVTTAGANGIGTAAGAGGEKKYRYRLFGKIYHHGYFAGGGHYTVDLRDLSATAAATSSQPFSAAAGASTKGKAPAPPASAAAAPSQWIRIDDDVVSPVSVGDVFSESSGGGETGNAGQRRDESRCAYLLFYERVR